jgi:2-succinyl-5-enolpyruvyl-6-hydroxy-3-cyclohexene-1-carboxylate synthase
MRLATLVLFQDDGGCSFEHLQKKTEKCHLYNIPNQFGKVVKCYSLTRRESTV